MNQSASGRTADPCEAGQIEPLRDFYGFLTQANGLVARAEDIDKLWGDICSLGVRLDRRLVLAWVGLIEPGSTQVRVAAHAGPASGYLDSIEVLSVATDARGRGPAGRTLREGRCIIVNRFLEDPATEPWHARARQFGVAASAAIPLRRGGTVCGALMLYANAVDVFDERIAAELDLLSHTLSYAIDAADERKARKALEACLLESRQDVRAILDAAHQTILMMTPEGETLAINRSGAERFGLTPQELVGRNQYALLPPEAAAQRRRSIAEALRTRAPVVTDDERDGRIFRSTIYPIGEGAPRVVVYAEELTERLAAERAAREAENQFVQVVNLASEGILVLDLEGNIVLANPRLHRLLGVEPGGLRGRAAVEFIGAADRADFFARIERVRRGVHQGPLQVTYRLRRGSGEEFPALISTALKTNEDGLEDSLVAVVTDISELQRAQADLAESKQRLEIALTGAAESIWQWNLDTGEAYWSPQFYRQLGYADQEFPGSADEWFGHMHPDDREATRNKLQSQLQSGQELLDATYRFRTKNGEWRWITGRGKVVKLAADGHPLLLTGTNVDVTVQHLEEERNRRQAERWLALLHLAQTGEYEGEYDEHDFLSRALEEAQRLTGSRVGFLHLVNEDQLTCELVAWTGAALGDDRLRLSSRYPIGQGGIWVSSFRERRGLIVNDYAGAVGTGRLAEDGAALRRLITVPVIENEQVRVIAWVGDKGEPYDQDDLDLLQILAADVWRIVRRRRAEAELREALQVVEQSLEAQRALNRKLEAAQNQLLQSEKLASIGQLAAGVAHEINNPIGFISSNLGTLSKYLSEIFAVLDVCEAAAGNSAHPDEFAQFRAAGTERELDYLRTDTVQLLQESKEGLERVRKIVQDLKDFSHAGEVKWEWADVHYGIDSTLNIVWNELKYNCAVVKRYAALPQIFCVVSQINQVFMNLLANAAQSIATKGEIVIATERAGDDAIRIRISDTGRGIAPEHLHRVFEPFFTTKPVGKGTGLGLSLAWSIVQHHQGQIEVESEPGKGTTFSITLPIEPKAVAVDDASSVDAAGAAEEGKL